MGLTADDSLFWRAAALQDLADVLEVKKALALCTGEPTATVRLMARLAAEPLGAGLGPADQLAVAQRRALGALQALRAPEPRLADEAARLAAVAWGRVAPPLDPASLQPMRLFEVHAHAVRLVTDPGPWYEPRNVLELDAGQLDSVRRCGVWSPIHLRAPDAGGLLVIAGSRRTRMQRVVIREGLEALAAGQDPMRPRPLLALVPPAELGSDIYLGDNLLRADETPWTIAERFAMQIEAGQVTRSTDANAGGIRAKDIAAKTGMSRRLVAYYLALAALPARLRAEGAEGRLGVKFAAFLAQIPDVAVQIRLFEVTLPLRSEAARMAAARELLDREGPDLADGRELSLRPAAEPAARRVLRPEVHTRLAAAVARAKGAARRQVSLVADWCAALEGDAAATERLPAELQAALLPVEEKAARASKPPPRRHPSAAKRQREHAPSLIRRNVEQWKGELEAQQARWEVAGVVTEAKAAQLLAAGIPSDAMWLMVDGNDGRAQLGVLFEAGKVSLEGVKDYLRRFGDAAVIACSTCGADMGDECEALYDDVESDLADSKGKVVHAERLDVFERLCALWEPQPAASSGPAAPRGRRWKGFEPEQQAAWEAAGVTTGADAVRLEQDFTPDRIARVLDVDGVSAPLGEHFSKRRVTVAQIAAHLRQLDLVLGVDEADPLEVVCPSCGAAERDACDGGVPHLIRATVAQRARELRPVAMGVSP